MRYLAAAEHMALVATTLWAVYTYLLKKHDQNHARDVFIDELRNNHLPHIQRALNQIAAKLGITLEE